MKMTISDKTQFHVCPQDAGQIVEVAYALVPDGRGEAKIIRRTTDRSDLSVSYSVAVCGDGEFDPQNGDIGDHGPWSPVDVRFSDE